VRPLRTVHVLAVLILVTACAGRMPAAPNAAILAASEREAYGVAMRAFIDDDPAAAIAEIEPLTRREPWYVPAHVLYQDSLRAHGLAAQAREWYASEVAIDPDDAARVLLAGRVTDRADGRREAAYRRAADLDPSSPWPVLALAYELTRAARDAAEGAISLGDGGYPMEAATERARAGDLHEEAQRLAADLLAAHPLIADAHAAAAEVALGLGVAVGDRESVRAALGHAERATELDPALPRWFALLARVRRELIDDAGAESALRKALVLDPDDPELLASLGRVLLDLGRPEDARDALLAARSAREDDLVIATDLGVAWHRSGDLQQAVRELERAARLAPNDPRPLEALALVHLDAGNSELAGIAAREYLERGGTDRSSAERILRELEGDDAEPPPSPAARP